MVIRDNRSRDDLSQLYYFSGDDGGGIKFASFPGVALLCDNMGTGKTHFLCFINKVCALH